MADKHYRLSSLDLIYTKIPKQLSLLLRQSANNAKPFFLKLYSYILIIFLKYDGVGAS